MVQLRRKDTEGVPTNGGQYAGATHDDAGSIALGAPASPMPTFAWPAVDGAGTEPGRFAGTRDGECVCSNNPQEDGFLPADTSGRIIDDLATAEGLICLSCGRFYLVDATTTEHEDVLPAARFDVSATAFLDEYDAYWDRNKS